ncbi:hypothetical protein E2C01_032154 [Portunus trituberculatus]|uniref:Uncharacterized protein n=1 Tax=Portunus trituberculatus TaxID=210409 RepID=A0A5B7F0M1_PORTR|nr:hypothetical protein [Portunus trituberculatus]
MEGNSQPVLSHPTDAGHQVQATGTCRAGLCSRLLPGLLPSVVHGRAFVMLPEPPFTLHAPPAHAPPFSLPGTHPGDLVCACEGARWSVTYREPGRGEQTPSVLSPPPPQRHASPNHHPPPSSGSHPP